jgi:hypothetical protein
MKWTSRAGYEMFVAMLATLALLFAAAAICDRAHAQELDPNASEQAYLTSSPVEGWLALATPVGRYGVIVPDSGCEFVGTGVTDLQGINVRIWPGLDFPPYLPLAPAEETQPGACTVKIVGRMDATPCVTNTSGDCDVAAAQD